VRGLYKNKRLFEEIFKEIEALLRNLKIPQRLRGFLKKNSLELRLFCSDVGFFKKFEAFLNYVQINVDFFQKCEAFCTILKLLKDIFRQLKCAAFIGNTRLFEEIYREIEALIRNLRFFYVSFPTLDKINEMSFSHLVVSFSYLIVSFHSHTDTSKC
jgi:hypothetical protein